MNVEKKVMENDTIGQFRRGLLQGFPIFLGYIPAAVAFGVLGATTGLSLLETTAMSVWVFAGASQFMALNLIQSGVQIYEIIFATFILNLRHLLMSTVLSQRISGVRLAKTAIAFGVTDETFVLSTCNDGAAKGVESEKSKISAARFAGVAFISYTGWVGGTIMGIAFANILPPVIMKGMGISLYAMFIALLVPSLKKSGKVALVAVLSAAVNWILSVEFKWSGGWSIVTATLLASAAGALIFKEDPL